MALLVRLAQTQDSKSFLVLFFKKELLPLNRRPPGISRKTLAVGIGGDDTNPQESRRHADLYWRQIAQLKAGAVCVRLYRNSLAKRLRAVEVIKAVASSGAIAGWAVFHERPFLWGCIIAAAQFLDAIKEVFPFAKLHKQAASLTVALELLLIDAEDEWEKIHIGRLAGKAIIERWTRLRRLQLEAENRHFPDGFVPKAAFVILANRETKAYLRETQAIETQP